MTRLNHEFLNLLDDQYKLDDLENHPDSVYGIWPNFQLAYLNPAWFSFAEQNNGQPSIDDDWGLGKSVLDCVSGQLYRFYKSMFKQCLDSGTIFSHEYECSSDTIYRRFHQLVYPLDNRSGLIIVNSIIVEQAHVSSLRPTTVLDNKDYLDKNGFICQCAYCRRVKNFSLAERWDWIPAWVKSCPENTSHSYCPICFSHYFHKAFNQAQQ